MKSFPNKDIKEISRIKSSYYHHLSDQVIETVKLQDMSHKDLLKRCSFDNPQVLSNEIDKGKSVMILMGHSGNWEWAGPATHLKFGIPLFAVYRRVRNETFNGFYFRLRSKFGVRPILDRTSMTILAQENGQHILALLADQLPSSRKGLWVNFLNQKTLFYRGPELLVRKLDYNVVFAHVRRNGRGKYLIHFQEVISKDSLIEQFVAFLDEEIRRDPVNWLWSHKRWKFQPKTK